MQPDDREPQPAEAPRSYCAHCGAIAPGRLEHCPDCGKRLAENTPQRLTLAQLAGLLTEFQDLHGAGAIGERCYRRLRDIYETRLIAVRPRRATTPAAPAAAPLAHRLASAGEAQPVPRPVGAALAQWTAARQADILLYLGAFLLCIAALIFVGYQGSALSGPARFGVLVAYTATFFGLGLLLPRWRRVHEAATVFLALGAILVPVNFIALRTQLFAGQAAPDRLIWLLGSSLTAALYLLLAARGYGRVYAAAGALAALLAWGSLARFLHLPVAWFGAWFAAAAAGVRVTAARRGGTAALEILAGTVGVCSLLFAHALAVAGSQAQLPVVWALASAGVAAGLGAATRRPSLALLPAALAATALTAAWAGFGLTREWYPCFLAAAGLGYLVAARFDDESQLRGWEAVAAACGLLALYGALAAAAQPATAHAALPATAAIVLAGACATFLRWRLWEALAALPPLAAFVAGGALWALGFDQTGWCGCWLAGVALCFLLIAETRLDERDRWRMAAGSVGLAALSLSHLLALGAKFPAVQLPLSYAVAAIGTVWDAARGRDESLIALAPVLSLFSAACLWLAGIGPAWWPYPAFAALGLLVMTRRWWQGQPLAGQALWLVIVAGALALPLAFAGVYRGLPAHGLAAFSLGAALLLAVALCSRGAISRALQAPLPAADVERLLLARLSAAYFAVAAGYLNARLGLHGADRAWAFAALACAAWLGLALFGRMRRDLFGVLVPAALGSTLVAALIAWNDPARAALLLALSGAGAATAFPTTRRWSLWAIVAALSDAALASVWRWQGLRAEDLALVYAGAGVGLYLSLLRVRDYRADERGVSIALLSWTAQAAGLGLATALVARLRHTGLGSAELVGTRAWAVLAITVAAGSITLVAEGLRLRARAAWIAGSAGLLLSILFAIAVARPDNVQAYTLPVGLYLTSLSFALQVRRRAAAGEAARVEAVLIAGLLALTLPAAVQSFCTDGSRYGFELIGIGVLFLLGGLGSSSRWLVAGGVVTLSCVALRWLSLVGRHLPYWLTLGSVGMALIVVGLLLLVQRDRWDRLRHGVASWWVGAATGREPRTRV